MGESCNDAAGYMLEQLRWVGHLVGNNLIDVGIVDRVVQRIGGECPREIGIERSLYPEIIARLLLLRQYAMIGIETHGADVYRCLHKKNFWVKIVKGESRGKRKSYF